MTEIWETLLILAGMSVDEELFRTKIQKILYFAAQKKLIDDDFKNKYFGPFSIKVAKSIESMVEGRYLNEKNHFFPNGYLGYSYHLSSDVQDIMPIVRKKNEEIIKPLCNIVKICLNRTSNELSRAAKIHYILKNSGKEMTDNQIIKSAKEYNWNITQEEIDVSTELLLSLDLIHLSN